MTGEEAQHKYNDLVADYENGDITIGALINGLDNFMDEVAAALDAKVVPSGCPPHILKQEAFGGKVRSVCANCAFVYTEAL